MKGQSLGLIETWGFVAAIEAADAACKAAVVSLLGYDRVGAGLVTVKLTGEVAATKAAVTAGAAAAGRIGKVVAVHVIPRPDKQLRLEPPSPGSDKSETEQKSPAEESSGKAGPESIQEAPTEAKARKSKQQKQKHVTKIEKAKGKKRKSE